MLSLTIYDPAGPTGEDFPYATSEPRLVSVSPTTMVLRSRVLEGPFQGSTETSRLTGSFDPASVNGSVSAWRVSIGGEQHFTIEFPSPVTLRRLFLHFDEITATGVAATGNSFANHLEGDRGGDLLSGRGGGDTLIGLAGNDRISGGNGADLLLGGRGSDELDGGFGADLLDGGRGNDTMSGGDGDDTYVVDWFADQDVVIEAAGGGHDIVLLAGFVYPMPRHVEEVRLLDGLGQQGGATGNGLDNVMRLGSDGGVLDGGRGDDLLIGAANVDSLYGGSGDDFIRGRGGDDLLNGDGGRDRLEGDGGDDDLYGEAGRDVLDGGRGDDDLRGDGGRDRLTGGRGADDFGYLFASDSGPGAKSRDVITDFDSDIDQFDFWSLYHPSVRGPDPVFAYLGNDAFTGSAGEVTFLRGIVRVDLDGDARADLAIELRGDVALTMDNFLIDS